jgi:hypothetical protein
MKRLHSLFLKLNSFCGEYRISENKVIDNKSLRFYSVQLRVINFIFICSALIDIIKILPNSGDTVIKLKFGQLF